MKRIALTCLVLLVPGLAAAQDLRSGPNAPAASSQIPPSDVSRDGRAGPNNPTAAPGDRDARTGASESRTAPPSDHRTFGGPPVSGARQPERSEGVTTNRDAIPPRPGARPDASTTGR